MTSGFSSELNGFQGWKIQRFDPHWPQAPGSKTQRFVIVLLKIVLDFQWPPGSGKKTKISNDMSKISFDFQWSQGPNPKIFPNRIPKTSRIFEGPKVRQSWISSGRPMCSWMLTGPKVRTSRISNGISIFLGFLQVPRSEKQGFPMAFLSFSWILSGPGVRKARISNSILIFLNVY